SKIQELEFKNLNTTIEFLKTEEGRLNIINFLTSNNIRFSFDFITDTLNAIAYVNNERIGQLSTLYDRENKAAPLGIYGFDNLGNVFTLQNV
ncbi:resolvase, partial [Pseudomonas bubulae]